MSIQLPRSRRELHFTGSVRALAPERPPAALGDERPMLTAPPPPSRTAPPTSRRRDQVPADQARTLVQASNLETMRGPMVSVDEEDIQTQALDREEIIAALFPVARRDKASEPAPNLPVPHFRSAAEAQQAHRASPTVLVKAQPAGGALPLSLWLVAALIAGIVSYNFAPQAVDGVAQAVRALDRR